MASKSFTLRCPGAVGTASRRACKALAGLRGKGGWIEFHAPLAAGSGSLRLNLGPDKNGKHIETEVQLKKAQAALADAFAGRPWFVSREKGKLSTSWTMVEKG
ncbi:unnamed protein product, partial [Prorocentrum cordatum]